MPRSEHIGVEYERGVGTITIDRRERYNALDLSTARSLRKAGIELCRDEAVRVVVIRGSGGIFSSGADLRYVWDGGDAAELGYLHAGEQEETHSHGEILGRIVEYLHAVISEIRRAPKPVLAAVDGVAAAGGLGLALSCDLVLASERSRFQFAYFKTALAGAESSTFFLPRLIGLRRALDFAFLGDSIDARTAAGLGLVSRVVADDAFETEITGIVDRLVRGPTDAYAAAKALLNESIGADRLDLHLERERDALVRAADGPDFAEGLEAFFGKRPPRFGRA